MTLLDYISIGGVGTKNWVCFVDRECPNQYKKPPKIPKKFPKSNILESKSLCLPCYQNDSKNDSQECCDHVVSHSPASNLSWQTQVQATNCHNQGWNYQRYNDTFQHLFVNVFLEISLCLKSLTFTEEVIPIKQC